MQIILIKNVSGIGRKGEVKNLKDGYVKNYIFPNKLGVIASPENLKKEAKRIKEFKKKKKNEIKMVNKSINNIHGIKIRVVEKADETGTLYGAITLKKISKLLNNQGYKIKPKSIVLKDHIKKIGEYSIDIIGESKKF